MRIAPAVACALAALMLAGCSDGDSEGEESGSGGGRMFSLPDDVTLLVSGPVEGASDAAIGGTLTSVEGCLGLQIGDRSFVAVWPEGTTPRAGDEPGLTLPDGTEVGIGSEIGGGGGFEGPNELPDASPQLPESCAEVEQVAMVQTTDE